MEMKKPKYKRRMQAWVVWQNQDRTEGRGPVYPIHVCENPVTAARLASGNDVQGCNCRVTEVTIFRIAQQWYGPCHVARETVEDRNESYRMKAKAAALEKAKAAGLTPEEIRLLQ